MLGACSGGTESKEADPGALPGASGICGALRTRSAPGLSAAHPGGTDGGYRCVLQIGKAVSARAFFGYAEKSAAG